MDVDLFKNSFKKVFYDCLLPNNALVAAPSHMPYYPSVAKSYLYVWPGRDTGFVLAAMLLLGEDHYEKMLTWLWERAEDFQDSNHEEYKGLVFRSYHPNGLIREHQFQPDQAGTILWSLHYKYKKTGKLSEFEKLVTKHIADNISRLWDGDCFTLPIEDLWEERGLLPSEGIFSYSMATVITGLNGASEILDTKLYKEKIDSMKNFLFKYCFECSDNIIPRYFGGSKGQDMILDGSMIGLVWPFDVGFDKVHLESTLKKIEDTLSTDLGVIRYPEDKYEGADSHIHINQKAGGWPLLGFWQAIAHSKLSDNQKARDIFDKQLDILATNARIRKNGNAKASFIPEQIFEDKKWVGVTPLLWAHAMEIFALNELSMLS